MTTRERKIEFIKRNFVHLRDEAIVMGLFRRKGLDWLFEEQLDEVISEWLVIHKQVQRLNRRNRKVASARRGRDEAA